MKKYSVVSVLMLLAVTTAVFAANSPVQTGLHSVSAQSDGGPIVWCRPNIPCDPRTEVKQVASDGGPIVWCRPNIPCDPRTEVKQLATGRALMVEGLTMSL